jgi:lipopolysaccharide biosynthesis glycosyltransferase
MPTKTKQISIAMACDERYAMPLASALRSIVDSNKCHWPLSVHILTDGFHELTRKRIQESLPKGSVSLYWLHISLDRFANLPTLAYISRMTFARFLLADLLPPEVTRVLYLDSDLLVLGDLGALWASSLETFCAGAVLDYGLDALLKQRDPKCAGMPLVKSYFNAGVLLINLDLWRHQQIGERAAQYLAEHPDSPFADQDALNAVLDGAWKALAEEWNYQRHLETNISSMTPKLRPAIVHFITAAKPWKREFHTPNELLFDNYRERTQFSRNIGMRVLDSWKTTWFLLKRKLKQFTPLRKIWYQVKHHD